MWLKSFDEVIDENQLRNISFIIILLNYIEHYWPFLGIGMFTAISCNSVPNSFAMSVCLHITTQLLNGFSWNFISESFTKICQYIPVLVKSWTTVTDTLHEDIPAFLLAEVGNLHMVNSQRDRQWQNHVGNLFDGIISQIEHWHHLQSSKVIFWEHKTLTITTYKIV